MTQNQYEVAVRAKIGDDKASQLYNQIETAYGKFLKTAELKWWKTAERAGLRMDPPIQAGRGNSGKESREVSFKDIDLLDNKSNVTVEGMVMYTQHFDAGPSRFKPGEMDPEKYTIGLLDQSGRGKISTKNPEVLSLLLQQNVQQGDFVRLQGGFFWKFEDGRHGVSITKYSQLSVNKKFTPETYFKQAGSEGLGDKEPCVLNGMVLNSKTVAFKKCPHITSGQNRPCGMSVKRDADTCYNGHGPYEWDEEPASILTIHDENGSYEVTIDGNHALNGAEIVVIGVWNAERRNIRSLWHQVKEFAAPGSTPASSKRETAMIGVKKTIKSFTPCPDGVALKAAKRELGMGSTDADAESLLREIVSSSPDEVIYNELNRRYEWIGPK